MDSKYPLWYNDLTKIRIGCEKRKRRHDHEDHKGRTHHDRLAAMLMLEKYQISYTGTVQCGILHALFCMAARKKHRQGGSH